MGDDKGQPIAKNIHLFDETKAVDKKVFRSTQKLAEQFACDTAEEALQQQLMMVQQVQMSGYQGYSLDGQLLEQEVSIDNQVAGVANVTAGFSELFSSLDPSLLGSGAVPQAAIGDGTSGDASGSSAGDGGWKTKICTRWLMGGCPNSKIC